MYKCVTCNTNGVGGEGEILFGWEKCAAHQFDALWVPGKSIERFVAFLLFAYSRHAVRLCGSYKVASCHTTPNWIVKWRSVGGARSSAGFKGRFCGFALYRINNVMT